MAFLNELIGILAVKPTRPSLTGSRQATVILMCGNYLLITTRRSYPVLDGLLLFQCNLAASEMHTGTLKIEFYSFGHSINVFVRTDSSCSSEGKRVEINHAIRRDLSHNIIPAIIIIMIMDF